MSGEESALCPRCVQPAPVRTAPSGAARLARHDWQGASCTGTGWEVTR